MAKNYFRLQVAARPENVGVCRLAVAHFAANLAFSVSDIEELKVAISEAVSNAIIHGYKGHDGDVSVEAAEVDGGLSLTISDEGVGIADIAKAKEASYSTDPERMGLGFVFMESFSNELQVTSAVGRGTTVRMVKLREASAAGAQSSG